MPISQGKDPVFVVESNGDHFCEEFQKICPELETSKIDCPRLQDMLRQQSPHIVIFHLDHQDHQIKDLLETYHDKHPGTYWVLSGPTLEAPQLIDYLRLGVSDYLKQPLTRKDIDDFLRRVDAWDRKHSLKQEQETHQVLSFFSCKGGVGLSLLASSTAAAITRRSCGKVLLADFVLQHGNIAELFDLVPRFTVLQLMENLERMDSKLLETSLHRHRSDLFILPCPKQPETSDFFSSKETTDMLTVLKSTFNYSILDVGHELNAVTIPCLDFSDTILLVTTPDLPSLCNVKTALDTFKKLGYPDEKVKLILNRLHIKGEISSTDIEKHLGYPIYHKIIDDPALVMQAINQGIPLHEIGKNSELVKCFEKLADRLSLSIKKEA